MKKVARIILFFPLFFSCSPGADKKNEEIDSALKTESNLPADTSWKTYKGIIPCKDCPGIAMELKIKDSFTLESYQFELKETYIEAENGKDKTYISKGLYNYWRGNSKDPDATIIVLNDDSAERAKRFFLRVNNSELKVVNNKGDEAEGELNFSLKKE